jgi:hypothetical protein
MLHGVGSGPPSDAERMKSVSLAGPEKDESLLS